MALRDLILRPGEVVLPRAPKIKKPAKVPTHRQVRAQRAKELLSADEKLLLFLLERLAGSDEQAIVLQSFIAHNGPLSEAAAEKVRAILDQSN